MYFFFYCLSILTLVHGQSRICNSVADARAGYCNPLFASQCTNVNVNCPQGTYYYCEDFNNQKLIACIRCPKSCPSGQYLGTPCPAFPQPGNVIPQCTDCTQPISPCTNGQYIGGCTGTTNYQCTACPVCPLNFYLVGCNSFSYQNGTCTPCSTCAEDTTSIGGCTGSQDRICSGGSCSATKRCTQLVCDFVVRRVPNCDSRWNDIPSNAQDPFNFLCLESTANGTCKTCPIGWRKQNDYCVPCPEGFSCDTLGNIQCKGECDIGFWPTCNNGFVQCLPCTSNQSNVSNAAVIRSGVAEKPEYCHVYFQCQRGFFLFFQSFTQILCAPCLVPEADKTQWQFTSYGVTFGDNYSCIYEPLQVPFSTNDLGFYGSKSTQQTSCDVGFTSVAGFASLPTHCIACENAPLNAYYNVFEKDCSFSCLTGLKKGLACIPDSCPTCISYLLPLNKPGHDIPSTRVLLITQHSLPIYTLSASAEFTVDYNYIYRNNDNSSFCKNINNGQSMEQDVPLTCSTCFPTSKINYNYYIVYTNPASPFVFFFLERIFGYNNRYVMWKVFKTATANEEGIVQAHWKLPGRVCSVSTSINSINQKEIMFLTLCNTSWISWIDVSDPVSIGLTRAIIQDNTQYIGRKVNRLIGQDTLGNQDGLRQEALFGKKLWVTAFNTVPPRVIVADEINCRLVEIYVSQTNPELNFAQTIGTSSCFDAKIGLFNPRLLSFTDSGNFLVWLSNKGVHQTNMQTRTSTLLITHDLLPANITSIACDDISIKIYNHTHVYNFTLQSDICPDGFIASSGSTCTPCPQYTYTTDHITCLPCALNLNCGINYSVQACTLSNNAFCFPCPALPANSVYIQPNSCGMEAIAFLPPCPVGYQLDTLNNLCKLCPTFATSNPITQQCTCYGNGTFDNILFQCKNVSTVFNNQEPFQIIPSWFNPLEQKCAIDECVTFSCYLASIVPRQCTPCPQNTISKNNIWCFTCPTHEEPNIYQDFCVCKSPRIRSLSGVCVCPPGYYEKLSNCIPCETHSIQTLPNMSVCSVCPNGFVADSTRTMCVPCPYGTFRVGPSMLQCTNCSSPTSFAQVASSTDCTECTLQCNAGFFWNSCPNSNNNSYFFCTSCTAPPANARWITARTNRQCFWECDNNFFLNISSNTCSPCSQKVCPPGILAQPCSLYQDSTCTLPCTNQTKPLSNAHYTFKCQWECKPGYILTSKLIFGQTVFSCIIPV